MKIFKEEVFKSYGEKTKKIGISISCIYPYMADLNIRIGYISM
jgi:hypothetical protein